MTGLSDHHGRNTHDLTHSQREPRWNVIGVIDQRVYVALVTDRGETIRVISLRAATGRAATLAARGETLT